MRRIAYDTYLGLCNLLLAVPIHAVRVAALRGLAKASLGARPSIGRGVRIEAKGGIEVGDHCNINGRVYLDGRGGLRIGSLVNISMEAMLLSAQHDLASERFDGMVRPTVVGDRAWIATRAVILPGAEIGEGAVVAAGAVVRGRVEPWTVVAGNPAREVATRPDSAQRELAPYRR